jgi:hypothetical protein
MNLLRRTANMLCALAIHTNCSSSQYAPLWQHTRLNMYHVVGCSSYSISHSCAAFAVVAVVLYAPFLGFLTAVFDSAAASCSWLR